jgi:ribosome-associated translation inhibitor RaiA
MPEGVIEWFDPATGTGRIARGGQRFTVSAVDVERAARLPGARVHFDIDRHRPGEALNVTSHPGGRSRPRYHGVGRLTGARRPDAKRLASADPFERPLVDGEVHPERVAAAWSRYVAAGDVLAAVALCAPTAVMHTTAGELRGPTRISEALEAWPYTGTNIEPVEVAGQQEAGIIAMTWPGWGPDRTAVTRVEHGEIADLRIQGGAEAEPEPTGEPGVELSTAGPVTDEAKQYAVDKVRHVVARVSAPVLFVRVRLRHAADPAVDRPAQAEALLDVNGRVVRAHTSQATMTEAVDELADRLWQRLQHQPHWSRTEGVPAE